MQIFGASGGNALLQHPRLLRWEHAGHNFAPTLFTNILRYSLAQKKRQHTTRASTWFRTTMIQAVATSFPTAAWSWRANCAAMPTTMRTAASHADWFRTNCFKCIVRGKIMGSNFVSFGRSLKKTFFIVIKYWNAISKWEEYGWKGFVHEVRHRHFWELSRFFLKAKFCRIV